MRLPCTKDWVSHSKISPSLDSYTAWRANAALEKRSTCCLRINTMRNPPVIRRISHLTVLIPFLFLLAACAPGVGIFSSGAWQSGGLQHQHIRALAVDPTNPKTIYAGVAKIAVSPRQAGGLHCPNNGP